MNHIYVNSNELFLLGYLLYFIYTTVLTLLYFKEIIK